MLKIILTFVLLILGSSFAQAKWVVEYQCSAMSFTGKYRGEGPNRAVATAQANQKVQKSQFEMYHCRKTVDKEIAPVSAQCNMEFICRKPGQEVTISTKGNSYLETEEVLRILSSQHGFTNPYDECHLAQVFCPGNPALAQEILNNSRDEGGD